MALDDAAVAEIKRLYCEGKVTLADIGRPHGLSPAAISQLARRQGWPMRRAAWGTVLQDRAARARLAAKLCKAITRKLGQMEKGMKSGELGSADFERDAKAVSSMIGGLEKVAATVEDADEERRPQSASAGASEAPSASEAERLHREIIERFERIQRRRSSEAGSQ